MAIAPEVIEALPEIVSEGEALAPDIAYLFRAAGSGAGQAGLWAADLVGAAICILALILAFAITLLLRALAAIFGVVPLIGGWVRDHIVNVGLSAIGAVTGWIEGALGTLVGVVWAPIRWLGSIVATIFEALYEAGEMGVRIVTHAIPQAVQFVIGIIDQTAGKLADFATQLYHGALSFAQSIYDRLVQLINVTAGKLADFATQLYHGAISFTQQQIGAVITWSQQNFFRLEQDIVNGVRTAENYTTQVGQGITTRLEREIQTRVQPLEDKLRNCDQDMCQTIDNAKQQQATRSVLPIDGVPVGWVIEAATHARQTAAEAAAYAIPLVDALTAAVRAEFG